MDILWTREMETYVQIPFFRFVVDLLYRPIPGCDQLLMYINFGSHTLTTVLIIGYACNIDIVSR